MRICSPSRSSHRGRTTASRGLQQGHPGQRETGTKVRGSWGGKVCVLAQRRQLYGGCDREGSVTVRVPCLLNSMLAMVLSLQGTGTNLVRAGHGAQGVKLELVRLTSRPILWWLRSFVNAFQHSFFSSEGGCIITTLRDNAHSVKLKLCSWRVPQRRLERAAIRHARWKGSTMSNNPSLLLFVQYVGLSGRFRYVLLLETCQVAFSYYIFSLVSWLVGVLTIAVTKAATNRHLAELEDKASR